MAHHRKIELKTKAKGEIPVGFRSGSSAVSKLLRGCSWAHWWVGRSAEAKEFEAKECALSRIGLFHSAIRSTGSAAVDPRQGVTPVW